MELSARIGSENFNDLSLKYCIGMKHENIVSVRAIIAASDGAEITYGGLCAALRSVGAIVPDELRFVL